RLLAEGKGFIAPEPFLSSGQVADWAPHPPAWPVVLSVPAFFGFRSYLEQQALAAVIGAATIVVVGLVGRRVGGPRVGLIAAGMAAIYPFFWRYERELLSETLTLLGVAVVLLLAYRFWARPSLGGAIAVAVVCGLLALSRAELVLLAIALLAPLVLLAPAIPWRRRVGWFAIGGATMAAVIAPWAVYNTARFEDPVFLTHTLGYNLSIANCDHTYSGTRLGFVDERCLEMRRSGPDSSGGDASTRDLESRDQAVEYMLDHSSRVPVVVLARVGRAWGVFRPIQQMTLEPSRGTDISVTRLAFIAYWLLVPAAVVGAVVLRRRRTPLFPMLAFVIISVIAVATTFGYSRYRAPAEVSLVLLAAVAVDAILARRRRFGTKVERASLTEPTHEPPDTNVPALESRPRG
ncbi:MAG: glycosyltransferase family 39 protein, partial [Acidimicrobiia bacterium]